MSKSLQIISALLSEGSFVSAAKRLNVSQSYLSQFIQKLEGEYGVELINRKTRPIGLTELGSVVFNSLQDIEVIKRKTLEKCCDYINLEIGEIKIASNSERTSSVLAPVIASFTRAHPKIKLNLEFNNHLDEICDLLSLGEADVGITFESLLSNDCDAYPLCTENYLLALPKNKQTSLIGCCFNHDGVYNPLMPEHGLIVKNFPLINTYRHNERQAALSRYLKVPLQASPISALTVQNRLSFVAQGVGCSICQEKIVNIQTAKEDCVFLSLDHLFKPQKLVIAWSKNVYFSSAAKAFCKEAFNYYRGNGR